MRSVKYPKSPLTFISKRSEESASVLASDVRVRTLEEDELRAVDPELRSFVNVNTPEELSAAQSRH